MTWLSAAPVALLAAVWLILPGLPASYALGLRGVTAWAVAPVVAIGSAGLGAVLAGRAGVPWSPAAALAPALVLAVVGGAGRWTLHHFRPSTARAERDGLRPAVGAVLGLAGSLVLGALTARRGMGGPDRLSQTYDAVFHYNAVERIIETGNGSSLTLGTLSAPGASSSFYPAAWHDIVSLVVMGSGASVPLATNMTAILVAALVWPLGCVALVRQLVGSSTLAALITPLVAVGFIAFPWSLLSFGVLWPNLIGLALVPVALAAVVAASGLAVGPTFSRRQAVVVGAVSVVALGLAHPNAVFSLAAVGSVPLAWGFVAWLAARVRARKYVSSATALVIVVAGCVLALDFIATTPLLANVRNFDWPAFESPSQAAGEVLLNATDSKDAAWAISLVVVLGLAAAARSARTGWLIPAHLVSAALYLLAASLETPLAALLTGPWYNDPYRLAAMVPITGVPLAVLGLIAGGSWLSERLPRRLLPDNRRPVIAAAAATLVLVVTSSGLYVDDHAEFIANAYTAPEGAPLLDAGEQAFFARIAPLIPPDAVVAQNPWSGSALLFALTGRRVLFPHMSGTWTPDQLYLAQHLRDAATDSRVCGVANRLGVDYLLVGVVDFWPQDGRRNLYPGLVSPAPDAGFDLVASDAAGNQLYRLTACGASATP